MGVVEVLDYFLESCEFISQDHHAGPLNRVLNPELRYCINASNISFS